VFTPTRTWIPRLEAMSTRASRENFETFESEKL
jgi:hypothetical protein